MAEVNALAPFGIGLLPIKQGKKVVAVKLGWWKKENGGEGHVSAPVPSSERVRLRARRSKTS